MTTFLIHESPLTFQPTLAQIIGLNEAIVLQQVQYWISNPDVGVWHEGFKWVHNSYPEWAKNFPFWSESGVKKIILRLEFLELLISAQFAPNPYDHTKSYRVNYDKLQEIVGNFIEFANERRDSASPADSTPEVLSPHRLLTETTNNMANGENQPLPDVLDGYKTPTKIDTAMQKLQGFGVDWQIAAGVEQISMPDEKDAQYKDTANLIATGMGGLSDYARAVSLAFMRSRGIIIPMSKVKGQRKAVREMAEMNVQPNHIEEAVQKLLDNHMTVTDLYSVAKTAIALANPAPDTYKGAIDGV